MMTDENVPINNENNDATSHKDAAISIASGATAVVIAPTVVTGGLTAIGFSSGGDVVFPSELISNR